METNKKSDLLPSLGSDISEIESKTSLTAKGVSAEVLDNLSNGKNVLEGKKGAVIDSHITGGYLAKVWLKKLGAEVVDSITNLTIGNHLENLNLDFIVISPEFNNDRTISDKYISLFNYLKEKHKDIRIFAYTAGAMPEEINLLKEFNICDVFVKPVNQEVFNKSLQKHLCQTQTKI